MDSKGSSKTTVFARDATGLVKVLSSTDAFLTSVFSMGFMWPLLYLFFAGSIYQGVDLPITVWLGLPVVIVMGLTYYLLSIAYPRSGGDYVWVSRIIHPAIGFMSNFAVAVILMSFIGIVTGWFTTYGLGIMFTDLNLATGNAVYATMASTLSSTWVSVAVDVVFIVVAALVSLLGIKITYRLILVTFALVVLGLLVYFGALLGAGPGGFQAGVNRLSGTNYDSILSAANSAGFVTTFTYTGTLLGSVWSFLNYGGFSYSVYVSGEVRHNDRSQLYGILGATLIFAVAMFAQYQISYYVFGGQFMNSASLLAATGNKAYTIPGPPVGQLLVVFANSNPAVGFLVTLGMMAATLGGVLVIFPITTRMIFAWSFDRVIPSRLSEVRGRGVPIYTVAIVTVVGLVFAIATIFTGFASLLLYESSGLWISTALVGLAALVLPLRRKDLFSSAPTITRKKVGSVPVVAILGFFTLIAGLALAYASVSPAFTLTPLNAPLLGVPVAIFIIGLIVYGISYGYHKSRHADLSMTFKEIPPE